MKFSASRNRLVSAVSGFVFFCACEALATAPRYVPDDKLAAYPIIVVAKWDKAPAISHNEYDKDHSNVVINIETYTHLNILATLKGKVEPGQRPLMMNWGITWDEDGTFVNSGTSTQLMGDVDDVTKPCLWFLKRTRSWDKTRKHEYLTVGNYREVQPLELKDFYVALGDRDAQKKVPMLLAADKPRVARRVLRYLCGGTWPWPYHNDRWPFDKPDAPGTPLREEASRVWDYLQSDAKDQRSLAACVYAELSGRSGITKIRTLLDDQDPSVRGIAIGVLARHRDEDSLDRFATAAQSLRDGTIACELIKALSDWKEERTVPALIAFLQNDEFAYRLGDDIGIPALKARQALVEITGHEFPFDIESSQKAWQEAKRIDDKASRTIYLEKAAPGGQTPLAAALVGLPSKKLSEALKKKYERLDEGEVVVTIRLSNLSPRPVTILAEPSEVDVQWPGGSSGRNFDEKEFTTIKPAESILLETMVPEDFLIAEPAERRLQLSYWANGNRQGVKAWIGTIHVEIGTAWKYERKVKVIEETWENGNLKATGTTVNGVKVGEWNYFNEQGDRIRVEYPGTGRGTAICNPEHPENKGAGKRNAR